MKSFILFLLLCGTTLAGPPITIRKNIYGGYNYSRGTTLITQSRPNIHRGYTYQGRISGYSHKTQSGFQFYGRKK